MPGLRVPSRIYSARGIQGYGRTGSGGFPVNPFKPDGLARARLCGEALVEAKKSGDMAKVQEIKSEASQSCNGVQ